MNTQKFLIGLFAVSLLVLTGVNSFKKIEVVIPQSYGASSGQVHSFSESFGQGIFVGGRVASSTVNSAETLLSSTLENATVLDYTLNVQDATLTFPATSTIGFMRTVGDTKTFFVRNATTTAAMDITFAGGTGMNYKKATSTKILVGDTDGSNFAKVTLIRKANTDIDMIVDLYVD